MHQAGGAWYLCSTDSDATSASASAVQRWAANMTDAQKKMCSSNLFPVPIYKTKPKTES